jgi:hypothetical protein
MYFAPGMGWVWGRDHPQNGLMIDLDSQTRFVITNG